MAVRGQGLPLSLLGSGCTAWGAAGPVCLSPGSVADHPGNKGAASWHLAKGEGWVGQWAEALGAPEAPFLPSLRSPDRAWEQPWPGLLRPLLPPVWVPGSVHGHQPGGVARGRAQQPEQPGQGVCLEPWGPRHGARGEAEQVWQPSSGGQPLWRSPGRQSGRRQQRLHQPEEEEETQGGWRGSQQLAGETRACPV